MIGCGGISTWADAAEYMIAGASAVQVGTASFVNSLTMLEVIEGLDRFCAERGIARVADLTGAVRLSEAPPQQAVMI